jgi:predicted transcriptional regulator
VEDIDEQMPRHLKKRRREKVQLILQRLRYSEYLSQELKQRLMEYLAAHMPDGSERKEHTLVVDVICDREAEYRNQVCYWKILQESGCLNRDNIQYLIEQLQDASPEVMAYLVQLLQEKNADNDFFLGLEL